MRAKTLPINYKLIENRLSAVNYLFGMNIIRSIRSISVLVFLVTCDLARDYLFLIVFNCMIKLFSDICCNFVVISVESGEGRGERFCILHFAFALKNSHHCLL